METASLAYSRGEVETGRRGAGREREGSIDTGNDEREGKWRQHDENGDDVVEMVWMLSM